MAADRRKPVRGSRPQQRRGRSRTTSSARGRKPAAAVATPASRPRLTGRAAILLIVLAVLAVSYASSLRAYLQQRQAIVEAQQRIDSAQADINELKAEKERWDDPEYQSAQARERLGYVRPGDTPFVVLSGGKALESESELVDPSTVAPITRPAWYDDVWESVKLAGHPPRTTRPPLTRIDGSDLGGSQE